MTMFNPTEHLRYHVGQQACLLFLIEALLKLLLPAFPFTELIVAQGSVVGGFYTVKTISNINKAKYEQPKITGE